MVKQNRVTPFESCLLSHRSQVFISNHPTIHQRARVWATRCNSVLYKSRESPLELLLIKAEQPRKCIIRHSFTVQKQLAPLF